MRHSPPRPRLVVVTLVGLAALAPAVTAVPAAATATAVPRDCHSDWTVTRHRASGAAATVAHDRVACSVQTGKPLSEPSLAITRSGTIVGTPYGDENTELLSANGGETLSATRPAVQQPTALWNTVDATLAADPRTGRLYMSRVTGPSRTTPIIVDNSPLPGAVSTAAAAAYGLEVYSSGDQGRTWSTADYSTSPIADWTKIFTAPQPASSTVRSRSGTVVYACGNSPVEAVGPGRLCLKSLDDGATFTTAGFIFPSPQVPDVCMPLAANVGTAGPDGAVYQPVSCANGSYVAVSSDEGSTYTYHLVPGVPGAGLSMFGYSWQVSADSSGVLYGIWGDGSGLHVTVSHDEAKTWTAPQLMTAPGQRAVTLPQLATGKRGQMGVVYYASPVAGASQTPWITQSSDADTTHPTFLSGPIDDPRNPSFVSGGISGPSPRADYIGASFDPTGQLWGYVVRQTTAADANNKIGTTGILGHLATSTPAAGPSHGRVAPVRRSPPSTSPALPDHRRLAATGLPPEVPALGTICLIAVGVVVRRRRGHDAPGVRPGAR